MFAKMLVLFVGLPLVELFLLLRVGQRIGIVPTIALVVITGILGAALARAQGFLVVRRIQDELSRGRVPTNDLIDGLLILIGGVVLLTPGLLTDLFGFSLLVPWVRTQIKGWLHARFRNIATSGSVSFTHRNIDPADGPG